MIFKASDLIKLKIDYGTYENELYFDVEQLKAFNANWRFPPDKIKQVAISGVYRNGIRQQDIQELSEFDKNVQKFYNYSKK